VNRTTPKRQLNRQLIEAVKQAVNSKV